MRFLHTTLSIVIALASPSTESAVAGERTGGQVRYVDDSASPGGDGLTWDTAFVHLQDALAIVQPGDAIHVGQGTYRPDRSNAAPGGTGNREATFAIAGDIALRGGYADVGAADPDERDIAQFPTILSGDLAGNDGPNFTNYGENSYHVLITDTANTSTLIEGLRVRGGNANAATPHDRGGGMTNTTGMPHVWDCVFEINRATAWGGAVYIGSGSPTFTSCMLANNSADRGGAVRCSGSSLFQNCRFVTNAAPMLGGAIYNAGSNPIYVNCVFASNSSGGDTGGVYSSGNNNVVKLIGCTIYANSGSGIQSNGSAGPFNTIVTNCIIWQNSGAEILNFAGGTSTVSYSNIQGGFAGAANINVNPSFVNPGVGDFHLQPGSPCIDVASIAALPNDTLDMDNDGTTAELIPFDAAGERRIVNGFLDMGAHEWQHVCVTDVLPSSPGVAGDGLTNIDDLLAIINAWGVSDQCIADIDGDNNVDIDDLLMVINGWGACD